MVHGNQISDLKENFLELKNREMTERPMVRDWKSRSRLKTRQGFESLSLCKKKSKYFCEK